METYTGTTTGSAVDWVTVAYSPTFYGTKSVELSESQFQTVDKEIETRHIILTTGEFNQNGNEFEITRDNLNSMVENFRNRVLGTDPPVDFSHNSEQLAAGWIVDLHLDESGDNLVAKIRWTGAGQEAIKKKEFRYFSPSFAFEFLDGSTGTQHGPTLRGGALTNIPFLRHLPPIVELHEKTKNQKENNQMSKEENISLTDHKLAMGVVVDNNEQLSVEVKNLTDQVKNLVELKEKNIELVKELADRDDKIKLAEKEKIFDSYLAKGLANESQRISYMDGKLDEFVKNTKRLNLHNLGGMNPPDGELKFSELPADEKDLFQVQLSSKMSKEDYMFYRDGKTPPKPSH